MTDLVGFRFVTLYESGLSDAIEQIFSLIRAGQKLPQQIFPGFGIHSCFSEGKFYANKIDDNYFRCADILRRVVREESSIEEPSLSSGIEFGPLDVGKYSSIEETIDHRIIVEIADENLYSSGHMIFDAIAHDDGYCIQIPVEFQVRTAVEDIWAEVNHKLLYKLRSPFVWSFDFENYFQRSQSRSSTFKRNINELNDVMGDFSDFSIAAKSYIQQFTYGLDDPDEQSPEIDASFGSSLFFRAGGNFVEPANLKLFSEYAAQLKKLAGSEIGSADAANCYQECFWKIQEIMGSLVRSAKSDRAGNIFLAGATRSEQKSKMALRSQQYKLCKFEIARLQASAIVEDIEFFDGQFSRIEDNVAQTSGWNDLSQDSQILLIEERRKQRCKDIYFDLCAYMDSAKNRIRPLSVLYFWKHIVATQFDLDLSRENIRKSHEILISDTTVPNFSVYKSLIPRYLAGQYIREYEDIVGKFSNDETEGSIIQYMSGLRIDLLDKVTEAIKLTLESHHHTVAGSARRGDLRLGLAPDEALSDASVIFECVVNAHTDLGVVLPAEDSALARGVHQILLSTDDELIAKDASNERVAQSIRSNRDKAMTIHGIG